MSVGLSRRADGAAVSDSGMAWLAKGQADETAVAAQSGAAPRSRLV